MTRTWLLILAGLSMVACGSGAERAAESMLEAGSGAGGSADVGIDIEDDQVVVRSQTEEGDAEYSIGGGEIPGDFPIPVMNGGVVLGVSTQETDSGTAYGVNLEYPAEAYEAVAAFYGDYMESLDGESQHGETETDEMKSVSWLNQQSEVRVGIALLDGSNTSVALNQGFG